jgi:hypothetical protein
MRYTSLFHAALLAGILTLLPASSFGVLLSDNEFDLASYDVVLFATTGGTPAFDYNRETFGGNPGAWMRMRISQPGVSGSTSVGIFLWKQAYDPDPLDPARPAIGTLDFEGDDICLDPEVSIQCYSTGLVVEQEGDYWIRNVRLAEDQFWARAARHGIRPAELSRIGHCDNPSVICPNGTAMVRAQPDFSANAPPLRFGFYTARSGGRTSYHGRDNWSVRVNPACAADADCDDADPCTVDACVAGACEAQNTCAVPGPSVRAEVLAQGTIGGVTTDVRNTEEKSPVTGLGDTANAQAASVMPAGATGQAGASLAGGLRAKADATLLGPGEFVGATATARHVRTFDVTGSPGPPPPTFDVNLLLFVDGRLSIRSAINSTTPNDIGASVAFDVFLTDGSGQALGNFQRFARLRQFNDLFFPVSYPTATWMSSFGANSDPDPLTITRATSYSELVTRTITLGNPPRIAVEMRLTAEAHTTPALPQWSAIANFFDTASVQVSSPDARVVLTEVDPSVTTTPTTSTTSTTLPARATLTIDGVRTGARGRGTIRARCVLADPANRKGASCRLQGRVPDATSGEPVAVTKVVRHRFDKRGVAKALLALNREGRRRRLAGGTLTVLVLATVAERGGTTTSLQAAAVLAP